MQLSCLVNWDTERRLKWKLGTCRTFVRVSLGKSLTEPMWATDIRWPFGKVLEQVFETGLWEVNKDKLGVIWSVAALLIIQGWDY